MTEPVNVEKIATYVPVVVENGVPRCPWCAELMVDDEGSWRCPLAPSKAEMRDLRAAMAKRIDEMIAQHRDDRS